MKVSPSMLKTFGDCALQGKYKYVDRLPDDQTGSSAHWGTSLHHAAEMFIKGSLDKDAAVREFTEYYDSVTPDYWNRRTSYTNQKDTGKRVIEDYVDNYNWERRTPIAAEHRFMVDIGEHQISGIVDLIDVWDDPIELIITDLKSGARPKGGAIGMQLNVQFTSYIYASLKKEFWTGYPGQEDKYPGMPNGEALFEAFQDVPRKGIWYDLKKNQEVDVGPRGEQDFGRLYRIIEQIDRAIEYEVFVPSVNADWCEYCFVKDTLCPVIPEGLFEQSVEIGQKS